MVYKWRGGGTGWGGLNKIRKEGAGDIERQTDRLLVLVAWESGRQGTDNEPWSWTLFKSGIHWRRSEEGVGWREINYQYKPKWRKVLLTYCSDLIIKTAVKSSYSITLTLMPNIQQWQNPYSPISPTTHFFKFSTRRYQVVFSYLPSITRNLFTCI